MIELVIFNQSDFVRFISWIKNKEELFQFAGPIFTYPLTDNQLLSYTNDSRRIPFKVIDINTKEVIGHCELNFENALPRLSRILIADSSARGKGIGKSIVHKMLEELFVKRNFESADLNVFDWNKSAIRCYEQVGFTINPDITKTQVLDDEIWSTLNMVIIKEDWLKKFKIATYYKMKKGTIILLIISLMNIIAFIFAKPLFIEFFALTILWKVLFILFLYGISIWSIIPCAIITMPFAYVFKGTNTFKSKWLNYTQVLSLIVGSIILLQNSMLLYSKYVLHNDQFKFIKFADVKGYDGNTDDLKIGTFSTEYVIIKRYKDHQIELYPNKDSVTYGIKWISKNEYQLINNVHITGMPDTLDIKIGNNTEESYDCYSRYGEYATYHHIKKINSVNCNNQN